MENKHRDIIYKNIDKLISLTDYEKLITACIEKEMLTITMRNYCEIDDNPHRRLFEKITRRGPKAFENLKLIFKRLHYYDALDILNDDGPNIISIRGSNYNNLNNNGGGSSSANSGGNQAAALNANGANEVPITRSASEPNSSVQITTARDDKDSPRSANSTSAIYEGIGIKLDSNDDYPQLSEFNGEIRHASRYIVHKANEVYKNDKQEIYPMRTRDKRGILFMVNNINFPTPQSFRNGAEYDSTALLHLFREMGFKLHSYIDLTKKQFLHLLKEAVTSEYARECECFVMALMTHGEVDVNQLEIVQFSDGAMVKFLDICEYFRKMLVPNLVKKPKILIMPFCRGEIADKGQPVPSYNEQLARMRKNSTETDSISYTHSNNNSPTSLIDCLILHATSLNYKAHRDPGSGNWYIQTFCERLAEHAKDTDFSSILEKIQSIIANRRTEEGAMQIPNFINLNFSKKLYFNPGVWEEEAAAIEPSDEDNKCIYV